MSGKVPKLDRAISYFLRLVFLPIVEIQVYGRSQLLAILCMIHIALGRLGWSDRISGSCCRVRVFCEFSLDKFFPSSDDVYEILEQLSHSSPIDILLSTTTCWLALEVNRNDSHSGGNHDRSLIYQSNELFSISIYKRLSKTFGLNWSQSFLYRTVRRDAESRFTSYGLL